MQGSLLQGQTIAYQLLQGQASLVPRPLPQSEERAWYTLCVHVCNIPSFGGIRKLMNIYRRLSMYTNCVHSCHKVDCPK